MTSDLPDVELYHQELLYNIKLRCRLKFKRKRAALLSDVDPIKEDDNDDKEFTESYVKNCGLIYQR